jgi:anti-anti-sigma factor
MAFQNWSDEIMMGELVEEPNFTEDLTGLLAQIEAKPRHVVLNFGAVDFLNSSNIAKLLKLRKMLISADKRLVLCALNTQVWGVFLITGLDKIFEYTDDTATALAALQLDEKQ